MNSDLRTVLEALLYGTNHENDTLGRGDTQGAGGTPLAGIDFAQLGDSPQAAALASAAARLTGQSEGSAGETGFLNRAVDRAVQELSLIHI